MDDYNDFPSQPTQSFAPQTKNGAGFFESLLSGAGQTLAGLFIGAGLYVLWAFTIGHQLGPHTHWGWWTIALVPAFWWLGMPDVLGYFSRWFRVALGRAHWTAKPATWYALLNWGALLFILSLTPFGMAYELALLVLYIYGRRNAAKGRVA